jgi:hypothetical protein
MNSISEWILNNFFCYKILASTFDLQIARIND